MGYKEKERAEDEEERGLTKAYQDQKFEARTYTNAFSKKVIDLIICEGTSPLQTILKFHSTQVMVAITLGYAWIPYQELIAQKKGILTTRSVTENMKGIIQKYQERGYDLKVSGLYWKEHKCEEDVTCPHTSRFLGDPKDQQLFCYGIGEEEAIKKVQR